MKLTEFESSDSTDCSADNGSQGLLRQFIAYASLFIVVCISLSWDLSRACFIILALVGTWQLIRNFPRLNRDLVLFCAPIVLLYLFALFSYLANESPKRGPQILIETFLLLLFALPLLHLYTRHPLRLKMVWGIFIIGVFVMGLSAIAATWFDIQGRAGGSTGQAGLFSTVVLATTGIVACSYFYLNHYSNRGRIVFVLATMAGLVAVFLSGSRIAWIGIPLVLLFMFLYYFPGTSSVKKIAALLILFIAIPIASYQVPMVKKRVDLGIKQYNKAMAEDANQVNVKRGLGIRILLWKSSLDIFADNPVFGVGPANFRLAMSKYAGENNVSARLPEMKHAHNQLIHTLITKGIIGALALILMLGSHLYVFIRYFRHGSAEVKPLAMAACMVIGVYILVGLTSAPLERKITLVFYAFSLSLLLGQIIALSRNESGIKTTES